MSEIIEAKTTCTAENCSEAPAFQIFELRGTESVATNTLCNLHARALIEAWTLECSKTRMPPSSDHAAPFTVSRIAGSFQSNVLVIYLRSSEDACFLFHIGKLEAWTLLALLTRQHRGNRPLTHEAMASAIERLGGRLEHVVINDVVDGALCAELHVMREGIAIVNDVRPSDAIALSFVRGIPILVTPNALGKAVVALARKDDQGQQ